MLRLLFPENADRQGSIKLIKNTVTATNALSEGIDFQIPENLRGNRTRTEQSIALSIPLVINQIETRSLDVTHLGLKVAA